ncbi:efflux RND transporter periplasmic adaptor subunit [Candidatus Nomurabacteria bacterium]|nr:efflux RND transporter periplasmic adaptor subunit [Candidatus Nomurabacteria bacterium]
MFKKKWFIFGGIVIVIIILVSVFNNRNQESPYLTTKVIKQDIVQTVEVTGQIESADDIDLNFKSSGLIQSISVKVGDLVKKGQALAYLRANNISSQVADAQAAVAIAQSDLEKLMAGLSTEDLSVIEEEVRAAEISHNTAVDNLDNLISTRDQDLSNLKATLVDTIQDKYFAISYALDLVEDAVADSDADYYLYVTDQNVLRDAKNKYQLSNSHYQDFAINLDTLSASQEISSLLSISDDFKLLLEQTSQALSLTFDTMLVTIENSEYTATVIATFKTNLNTQSTAINAGISSLQTAAASLRTKNLYYQTEIAATENAVQSALANLSLAQAKLRAKQAPPRDFEIASAQANVARAQATLNRYYSELADTIIKAPVDGIITKVNFNPGETSSLSQSVISMIGDSDLQIEVEVPESDITKIAVDDKVKITLDAFSSDDQFMGVVTFIDPAATVINDVIYYKVKVSFDNIDQRMKSGMTADLTIFTDQREGVLAIPARSIIYQNGGKYVRILSEEMVIEKEVGIGLKGDDGMIEIISGLNLDQEVITFDKTVQ